MVASNDLGKAVGLSAEYASVRHALKNLEDGGAVVTMIVSGIESSNVTVVLAHVTQTKDMIDGIVAVLDGRQTELLDELGKLGVTDLEEPTKPAPRKTPLHIAKNSPYRFRRSGP